MPLHAPTEVNRFQGGVFWGLLLLLTTTPYFWDLWQAGQLLFPLVPIILFLLIVIGLLSIRDMGLIFDLEKVVDP